MKQCLFFVVFASLFLTPIEALRRDYSSTEYTRCVEHLAPQDLENAGITPELIKFIPLTRGESCRVYDKKTKLIFFTCRNPTIYAGYLDPLFHKYTVHLRQQLEYCSRNRDCTCY